MFIVVVKELYPTDISTLSTILKFTRTWGEINRIVQSDSYSKIMFVLLPEQKNSFFCFRRAAETGITFLER